MEVHHHVGHTEHKKNWKEYFYEFLMLFLAVSSGFFAENQREHIVEHKRANQFAASLFDDIKKDTSALNAAFIFSNQKIEKIDSLVNMLNESIKNWNDTLVYANSFFASRVYPFERTAATFEQIKSSGSLRYFNQVLVNLLNDYDVQAKKVQTREDIDVKFIVEQYMPLNIHMFNAQATYEIRMNKPVTHKLIIMHTDAETIQTLINNFVIIKSGRLRSVEEYKKLNVLALNILSELEKEYHLK